MKKIIVILLLVVYSTSTIGATIHLHYCMGDIVNWSFTTSKNKNCGKCGMKEDATKKGCCKEDKKEIKIKAAHQKGNFDEFKKNFLVNLFLVPKPNSKIKLYLFPIIYSKNYYPPPEIFKQNYQILFCSYLI